MTPTLIFLTKSFLTKHSENIAQSKRILTQNILKDIHTIVKFIWPVWLNLWAFVSELYGCGFESRCYHWNFRYKELVPSKQIIDIQAISESNSLDTCMWQKQKNTQSIHHADTFSQHKKGQIGLIIECLFPN